MLFHLAVLTILPLPPAVAVEDADPPAVKVTDIARPAPAKWTEFRASGPACQLSAGDKTARWVLVDDEHARVVPDSSGRTAVFTADRPGAYRIMVLVGDAEPARVRILVGNAPPPGPNPPGPTPPGPPPPDAPWLAGLKKAYEDDATQLDKKRAAARDLAELYRQAAGLCVQKDPDGNHAVLTSGELARRVRDAGHTLAPDVLVGVRRVVAEELVKIMPADAALTDAQRKAAAELFRALAATLDTF